MRSCQSFSILTYMSTQAYVSEIFYNHIVKWLWLPVYYICFLDHETQKVSFTWRVKIYIRGSRSCSYSLRLTWWRIIYRSWCWKNKFGVEPHRLNDQQADYLFTLKWKAFHGIGKNLIFNYYRFLVMFIFELMNLSGICSKLSHGVSQEKL